MTKIEEEIFKALIYLPYVESDDKGAMAKAAAEVAKNYIVKALTDFECCKHWQSYEGTKEQWLKENGIE